MQKWAQKQTGFTIVELLIVVVVIAILAAITIVAYNGIQNRAKVSAMHSAVSQAAKKVQVYAVENGEMYPTNAAAVGLVSAGDTTYEVVSNNAVSPKGYCVTVTTGNLTYFQTSAITTPTPGTCIGMLAWWPFNGNAQDASGNAVHATVNGATPTVGANGKNETAYQLGETAQNINVGIPASFSVLPTSFTYSIWVARTGTATNQWPQIMGSNDTHRDFGIRTAGYGSNVYFEYGLSPFDGSTWTGGGTTNGLNTLNEWHLVSVTYDGTILRTYWDGAQRHSTAVSQLRPTMPHFSFTSATNGWPGKIDDARVYSRALSASEIQTLYTAGAQ